MDWLINAAIKGAVAGLFFGALAVIVALVKKAISNK